MSSRQPDWYRNQSSLKPKETNFKKVILLAISEDKAKAQVSLTSRRNGKLVTTTRYIRRVKDDLYTFKAPVHTYVRRKGGGHKRFTRIEETFYRLKGFEPGNEVVALSFEDLIKSNLQTDSLFFTI